MKMIFKLTVLTALFLVAATAFGADEVKLLNATWSSWNHPTPYEVYVSVSAEIEVKDIGASKEVVVRYHNGHGNWEDGFATYLRDSKPGYEIWSFSQTGTTNAHSGAQEIYKFAVKLSEGSEEHWDSNGGENYYAGINGSYRRYNLPSLYIKGSWGSGSGWSSMNSIEMTKRANSTDIWDAKDVYFGESENERFKFDVHNDWSMSFGDFQADGYADEAADATDISVPANSVCDITFNQKNLEYSADCVELRTIELVATAVKFQDVMSGGNIFSANLEMTLADGWAGGGNIYNTYVFRGETEDELAQKIAAGEHIGANNNIQITMGTNYERSGEFVDYHNFYKAGKTYFYKVVEIVEGHHNSASWKYQYESNVASVTLGDFAATLGLDAEAASTDPIETLLSYSDLAYPNQGNTSCSAVLFKGQTVEELKETVISYEWGNGSGLSQLSYGTNGSGTYSDTDFAVEDEGETFFYQVIQHCSGHYTSASWNRLSISEIVEVEITADDWKRTVIFIYGETQTGQDMFIRGGLDHDYANSTLGRNCATDNFECSIPIRHLNDRNSTTNAWKDGDLYLDWYGIEEDQGAGAEGTALDWTTDAWPSSWGTARHYSVDGYGEAALNDWGHHYWMMEVLMDCSKTADGWFELKSYISNGPGWEGNISQENTPYASGNHFAQCGKINVFRRNESGAEINDFPVAPLRAISPAKIKLVKPMINIQKIINN